MAKGYEFRRIDKVAIGNVADALKIWIANILSLGNKTTGTSVYYSPDDFTAVYAGVNTLTIGAIANLPAAPTTERFSEVIVTRANGDKVAYSADDPAIQITYAAPTLTVTGAAFVTGVGADLGYKVKLYYQAKGMGIHDAVKAKMAHFIMGRAFSGNPPPVSADEDNAEILTTLLGQIRMFMDSALNPVNDGVENTPKAPTEVVAHGQWIPPGAVGNTSQLTVTSAECSLVVIMPDPFVPAAGVAVENYWGGFSYTVGNGTIIGAGPIPVAGEQRSRKIYEVSAAGNIMTYVGTPALMYIDDPSKIYGACSVIGNAANHRAFYWVAFGEGHIG